MLEIGKYYLQRNGIVVGPLREYTGKAINSGFKFCTNQDGYANRTWKANGSFLLYQSDTHPYDIVSGVQFTPVQDLTVQLTQQPKEEIVSKEFKIEAGKFYKDRNGDIHGPMLSNDNEDYPFMDQEDGTYTTSGSYYGDTEDEDDVDLIEEVPNPYEINQKPTMRNTNNPTIEEVLSAIQRLDDVIVVDNAGVRYNLYRHNTINLILNAKSFEIKAKQPVVKFKYVYQHLSGSVKTTQDYYESDEEFLTIQGDIDDDYAFFEPIQATRKEF